MSTYRIEVHHTTHIDKIPVAELDAAIDAWRAKPWWFRLMRRSPLVRAGSMLTIREEPIDGTFPTVEDADAAARREARERVDDLRPDSTVAVVEDGADGGSTTIGGWYAGGERSF